MSSYSPQIPEIEVQPGSAPLVSVVILSYNRPACLKEALASIFSQTYGNVEVLVVDNASPCATEIREVVSGFPSAKLFISPTNLGYAGGMNAGVSLARGKYVYLSEDDMCSEPRCVEKLVAYAESDASAGVLSGSLYSRDTNALICCGGQVHLRPAFVWRLYDRAAFESCSVAGPYCTDYVTGAMMFFSRQLFLDIGGFRNDFFMYFEDTELCQRLLAQGRAVVVVPDAVAYTRDSTNSATTAAVEFHKFKNLMALYLLHAKATVIPEFLLRNVVLGLLRRILSGQFGTALRLAKAAGWVALSSPRLLRERGRKSAVTDFSSVEVRSN